MSCNLPIALVGNDTLQSVTWPIGTKRKRPCRLCAVSKTKCTPSAELPGKCERCIRRNTLDGCVASLPRKAVNAFIMSGGTQAPSHVANNQNVSTYDAPRHIRDIFPPPSSATVAGQYLFNPVPNAYNLSYDRASNPHSFERTITFPEFERLHDMYGGDTRTPSPPTYPYLTVESASSNFRDVAYPSTYSSQHLGCNFA